jgi:hypothetical protein
MIQVHVHLVRAMKDASMHIKGSIKNCTEKRKEGKKEKRKEKTRDVGHGEFILRTRPYLE